MELIKEAKRLQELAGIKEIKVQDPMEYVEFDFHPMDDEFEGAMQTGDYTKEEYLQGVIDATPEELLGDGYLELVSAVESGEYTENEAIDLAKKWARNKLRNLSNNEH
jgi:hypothetical protein